MNSKHILIPIDLMRSPCDALIFARNMAADSPVSVTLLYVLNLNIIPTVRDICDELCAESEKALKHLAWLFFGEERAARIAVRMGAPHREILAQAVSDASDLILLSAPETHSWKRPLRTGTAKKIIDNAACPTMVLPRGVNLNAPRGTTFIPSREVDSTAEAVRTAPPKTEMKPTLGLAGRINAMALIAPSRILQLLIPAGQIGIDLPPDIRFHPSVCAQSVYLDDCCQ
jgi:nucleotide-binding universal stress UspA family protein